MKKRAKWRQPIGESIRFAGLLRMCALGALSLPSVYGSVACIFVMSIMACVMWIVAKLFLSFGLFVGFFSFVVLLVAVSLFLPNFDKLFPNQSNKRLRHPYRSP